MYMCENQEHYGSNSWRLNFRSDDITKIFDSSSDNFLSIQRQKQYFNSLGQASFLR